MALEKDSDRAEAFSRRAFIVGAFQAGFLAVLGGRLAWLQAVLGNRVKTLAQNKNIDFKKNAPPPPPNKKNNTKYTHQKI